MNELGFIFDYYNYMYVLFYGKVGVFYPSCLKKVVDYVIYQWVFDKYIFAFQLLAPMLSNFKITKIVFQRRTQNL